MRETLVAISEENTKNMDQYKFVGNILELNVRKSPLIIRVIFFTFSFAFFLFPALGMISSIADGKSFHIMYLVSIGIFSLLGFYLLRISLWNTYGKETLSFSNTQINYEADYGWFKDAKKEIKLENPEFSFNLIGYEDDNKGVLIIENGNKERIECAVKMPREQVEKIITLIETATNRR